MQTVNIHEAKTHLSRFADQAATGEEILIARDGRPVDRLVAPASDRDKPRTLGFGQGPLHDPQGFDCLHDEAIQSMFGMGDIAL